MVIVQLYVQHNKLKNIQIPDVEQIFVLTCAISITINQY